MSSLILATFHASIWVSLTEDQPVTLTIEWCKHMPNSIDGMGGYYVWQKEGDGLLAEKVGQFYSPEQFDRAVNCATRRFKHLHRKYRAAFEAWRASANSPRAMMPPCI